MAANGPIGIRRPDMTSAGVEYSICPRARMRVFDFNSAIVRLPARSVVNGLRANQGPAPVFERVLAEHAAYIQALRHAGLRVTVLEALEQFPDSIFVEDPALV